MNYVIFCDKSENKAYIEMFKAAANSNLLAAENILSNENIDNIKIEYNPHGIIIANPAIDIDKIKETVKYTAEEYDDMRIIVIYPDLDQDNIESLKVYTSDVITRAITSEDFGYIIDNKLTAYDIDILNEKKPEIQVKKRFTRGFNAKTMTIAAVSFFAFLLVLGIVLKTTQTQSEDVTLPHDESQTETHTVTESEGDTFDTLATETETESEIETKTEEQTSAISKPTEKETDKETYKETDKNGSSSNTSQSQVQAPVQSQVSSSQHQQPQVQQTDPQVATQPSYTPPTSSEIVDDGKIYLDPTSVTLKVGQTYEIYVTGLSAANGCSWNVQNAAIVDFVGGDTTKVTVKAKGVGVTIVTATSKLSGSSAQCIITVKK